MDLRDGPWYQTIDFKERRIVKRLLKEQLFYSYKYYKNDAYVDDHFLSIAVQVESIVSKSKKLDHRSA